MEHRSSTVFFHCSLSWACRSIWVHFRPICRCSCSADLLQLFFGLPLFRLPWGFQKRVTAWLRCYVVFSACGRSISTSFFWFGSSSSLPGFLQVDLRYWWCSAILRQGCYVGNDLWRLGFLLRYSSLLSKFRLRTSRPILHLYWRS